VAVGRVVAALALRPGREEVAVGLAGRLEVRTLAGDLVRALPVREGEVQALAFSADGTRLCSGGQNNALTVWDPEVPTPLHVLTGTTFPVRAVAVSPAGRLASATGDNNIRTYLLADGSDLSTWLQQASALAFSGEPSLLAGGADGAVKRVDPSTGQVLATVTSHPAGVVALVPDAAGQRVLSVGHDRTLRMTTLAGVEQGRWTLPAPPLSLAWLGARGLAAAGLEDGTVAVVGVDGETAGVVGVVGVDGETAGVVGVVDLGAGPVRALAATETLVIAGTSGGTLVLLEVRR
jgi:WD40 repeat protein